MSNGDDPDRTELLAWVKAAGPERIRRAFLVHGEDKALESYSEALGELGVRSRHIPDQGERVKV